MSAQPDTEDARTVEDFQTAHRMLTNEELTLANTSKRPAIPDELFEQVARTLVVTLQEVATHPERSTKISIQHTEEDGLCVKVRLFVKRTPNTLNYLGNAYDNVVFMGSALRNAKGEPGSRKIPEGWMRVKYWFYEPDGEAFDENDSKHLPPLDD